MVYNDERYEHVLTNIDNLLNLNNMKPSDLDAKLGLSPGCISKCLKPNSKKYMSVPLFLKICDVLEVNCKTMFEIRDDVLHLRKKQLLEQKASIEEELNEVNDKLNAVNGEINEMDKAAGIKLELGDGTKDTEDDVTVDSFFFSV